MNREGVTLDELNQAKNKVSGALGAAERAADGPPVVARVPLDVSPALYSR